ncbi:hypothetical protein Ahy_Scaffold6g108047 [Arachis hypogaea]|uniref:Uncharacterized protein n=1 Tax=Arachis hypogaea TaxID=3818 RepID=A0A444WPG2_ARAHY|nr:hypothetical protein Ahy_Scaffold6g108047 [Arachis hypogaea]
MVEFDRLNWHRFNQKKLRAPIKSYKWSSGFCTDRKENCSSKHFTGGPRYTINNCKGAFGICKYAGYPSYFITIRAFKIKLDHLIQDLKECEIFGSIVECKFACVYINHQMLAFLSTVCVFLETN